MSPLTVGIHTPLFSPQVEVAGCSAAAQDRADWSIFLLLAVIQVLDGVLTAIGVGEFGTKAEGNMLVRQLIEAFGTVPALTMVKSVSIVVIFSLAQLQHQVAWVQTAVRGVTLLYLVAAIVPWSWILLVHLK